MAQNEKIDITPFFLDGDSIRLFCVMVSPSEREPVGGVLYLHPFAEEMHKSRRMAALTARALAEKGLAVLLLDLTGCGDSQGDFADASWSGWRKDALLAYEWLSARTRARVSLWGLRTGATLGLDICRELPGLERLILWQPVTNTDLFLNQFLRIRLASEMLAGGQAKSGTKELRARLDGNDSIEVGGYGLSPVMAKELGGRQSETAPPPCPVRWLEIGAQEGNDLTPASQRIADAWRDSGASVLTRTVKGDPFWSTQEISECSALIDATLAGWE